MSAGRRFRGMPRVGPGRDRRFSGILSGRRSAKGAVDRARAVENAQDAFPTSSLDGAQNAPPTTAHRPCIYCRKNKRTKNEEPRAITMTRVFQGGSPPGRPLEDLKTKSPYEQHRSTSATKKSNNSNPNLLEQFTNSPNKLVNASPSEISNRNLKSLPSRPRSSTKQTHSPSTSSPTSLTHPSFFPQSLALHPKYAGRALLCLAPLRELLGIGIGISIGYKPASLPKGHYPVPGESTWARWGCRTKSKNSFQCCSSAMVISPNYFKRAVKSLIETRVLSSVVTLLSAAIPVAPQTIQTVRQA